MILEESERLLTPEELVAAEQRLKVVFPTDFREFLLKHNGGRPTPNKFDFIDTNGESSNSQIDFFFAIFEGHIDNLEIEYRARVEEDRLLPHFVPIANDPFGNLICLSVRSEDLGKVYFWDHEIEPETAGYENMSLIADSFTEFLGKLT
ncbi:SMI1/KNR4 family protein [Tumebacillus sp. DT12]|uniref:SMI1/KNR4 family protein n=1 Tax=Tumebacillus lacus TaxID=2995335 RepID=A0ABT3X2G5_9BACL|nr:SMI1/KNR4 family protein [Tumebacillus lacus]MCX7570162.1 SMI1/KNR4 family protein [Tumebacillus lacus]